MGEDVEPWREGQQAWGRLAGWYRDTSATADRALVALADIGLVRRLLDQAEFEAVRTARRNGKSWSEIAIKLGVTRQSAWERWRDVDDDAATAQLPPVTDAAKVRPEEWRRSSVLVPNVIGKSLDDGSAMLTRSGLVAAVGTYPDRPLAASEWPDAVVTDQSPESGAMVPPGSSVTLWVDRGGGSGVREPRRPKPDPRAGRKMWDEVTDEAVG